MSQHSGKLFADVVRAVSRHVQHDETRHTIYHEVVRRFIDSGCTDFSEAEGIDLVADRLLGFPLPESWESRALRESESRRRSLEFDMALFRTFLR